MTRRPTARMIFLACVMIVIGLMVIGPIPAFAVEALVWRIGSFDHSSSEFRSQGIDYSDPKQAPIYRVGQSKDSEDWWRFQPGPANGMTGGHDHPFTVLFDIKQPQ